jgi:hypothetical protein
MSRRTKTILVIVIVIVGILLLFFLLGGRGRAPETPTATTTPGRAELPLALPPRPRTPQEIKELSGENQVLAIARTFAERYGSFSNQGGFSNLLDLEPIVTGSLWADLEEFHRSQQGLPSRDYYGINTRVLSVKLTKFDLDSFAESLVQTQREEARFPQSPFPLQKLQK